MTDCTDPDNYQVAGCCTTADFEQCTSTFSDKVCSCIIQADGRSECGYLEDDFFWPCPSRCCEKGKGCPGECFDNPPETSYSGQPTTSSTEPSTISDTVDDTSCPSGCQKTPEEDDAFFVRKEMLVVYAILMGMPLMIWFTSLDIKIKSFVTVLILLGLGLYIPLILLPKYKQA